MSRQIFNQQAKNKRKLSNVVLCYHGCVLGRADSLIFREHFDDIVNQIEDLMDAGYRFVSPSEYDNWYEGAPGYDQPLAVIHLDDGLESVIPICEWMIKRQIPFGLAIISSRNKKYDPQQGFIRWSKLKEWIPSGYCEILRHTHNIHNLTIMAADGSPAPVLEGPCWIDEPANLIYRKPGDTRWYWDFDIIDTTTWGFPLFGSDPYSDFETAVSSDIYFRADTTMSVSILRFWAALHRPAGAGYDCTIEVFADDVSLGEYIITPFNYATRSQWVEREFYTLPLTSRFDIVAGNVHHLRFETRNTGNGVFILYVLPETSDSDFYCVTSCQSLSSGKKGPDYSDFPANRPWPGRAGIILASGSGRQATDLEYQNYIQADTDAQTTAIETWLNADWYDEEVYYNTQRTQWSLFTIAGCEASGATITAMIKWVAKRPAGYDPLATTMFLECLKFKQAGPVGLRYACLVRIDMSSSKYGPWTQVGEWVPTWSYYKWTNFDIDSVSVTIGNTYWFRFTTLNRSYNADYPTVENPDNPKTRIPGTNLGKISIYLDMPFVNLYDTEIISTDGSTEYVQVLAEDGPPLVQRITVDKMLYDQWVSIYSHYYPGFSIYQDFYGPDYVHYLLASYITPPLSGSMVGHVTSYLNTDAWISIVYNYDYTRDPPYPYDVYVTDNLSGKVAQYGAESVRSFYSVFGNPLFGAIISKRNASGIIYDQMIYPFGSFNADSSPTSEIKPVLPISATLQTVFDTAGIRSGYTIWPSRNDLPERFREPFCRCTTHTKSRLLLYGDVTQQQTRSGIANYSGLRWADAKHGGLKWQVAIEPDPNGNATIKNSYAALDTVAFDAYFFSLPDVDHVDGWILEGEINDGGTYDTVVYHDDKTFLQTRGVHCSLIISNYNITLGDVDPAIASYVVNNAATFIPLIVGIAVSRNWDGITCNLEGIPEADRSAATSFYQALGTALKAVKKQLHMTAPAKTDTDYDTGSEWWWGWCDHAAIIGYVDRMKIMSYTETGPGTPPGPHAPDSFLKLVYAYIGAIIPEVHKKRILVGVNSFGHIWRDAIGTVVDYGSSHACMAEALGVGAEILFSDGEAHFKYQNTEAWWGSPETIVRAVNIAAEYGFGGVGVWKGDDGDLDEHYPLWPQIGVSIVSTFIDIKMPDDLSYGFKGGPGFKTDVGIPDNGNEQRSLRWDTPLLEYEGSFQLLQSEMESLLSFFRVVKGRFHSFRFKDWLDFQAANSTLGLGDGTRTAFQLVKTYTFGAESDVRVITKPVVGSVVVKDNGVVVTAYTLDYNTGIINFTVAPITGHVITATFEFDVQCRFDQDKLDIMKTTFTTYDVNSIILKEVRQ